MITDSASLSQNNDEWSLDLDPATIVLDDRLPFSDRSMTVSVEDADDVAVYFNRVGNPDRAKQRGVHAFRNCRLSGAGHAGQEE